MSCERFRPAIAAHAGGAELDAGAARHLSGCAACRGLLDAQRLALAELDAELGRSLAITASPDFVAKVSRAAGEIRPVPARPWLPAPVWTGLALAAAIVFALWLRQPAETDFARPEGVQSSAEPAPPQSFRLKPEATPPSKEGARSIEKDVASGSGGQRRSVVAQRSVVGPTSADPPVIVDPRRALALERLRELTAARRLDEKMLPPPVTPQAALAELTIAPLAIAEIQVPDVEIVGRPPAAPQRQ